MRGIAGSPSPGSLLGPAPTMHGHPPRIPPLRPRDLQPELMDDPALPAEEHRRALAGLARLNSFSNSVGVLWPSVKRLARELGRPIKILDVATGGGDVPLGLCARAKRAGVEVEVHACDISPVALETAAARTRAAGATVHYFPADALGEPLPTGFDIVTCSLFLHHLSDDDAVVLLARLAAATECLVLVNDLSRSRWNLGLVWTATRLLTRSPVVHIDGPSSVLAAFTSSEAAVLALRAGLTGAIVETRFPCRWLLTWRKPA